MDQTKLRRAEIALERKIYKKSYYEFYKVAYAQLEHGADYYENWHAKYLCDILQKEVERIKDKKPRDKDIIINIPFRSSKSLICTIILPVWAWTIFPSAKFITVSYSGSLALEHSGKSRDLIQSAWFQRLYGHKIILKNTAVGHYENTLGGSRRAVGTMGQITGSGADIIIVDDPQDPEMANSEVERANSIRFYGSTLFNRLNQPDIGMRILVQQRLHMQDLSGHLMDEKDGRPEDHQHICIPGELDREVLNPPELEKYYVDGLFWPGRWNHNTLKAVKKGMTELEYAGQMGQRPVPAEGNLFKKAWFEIIQPNQIVRDVYRSPVQFIIDTAYTEKQENDPSGLLAGFKIDDTLYILNFIEGWWKFPDLCEFTKQYCSLNGYGPGSSVGIEPKASGISVVQQLGDTTKLNVYEIKSEILKGDKVSRASGASVVAKSGKIKLIAGPWNKDFLNYVSIFPKAKHDEAVDCLVYMVDQHMPTNSFLSAFL